MGRLDELDLSLKLSKEEEAERLAAGWRRLEALRLALGGKLPGYGLGPPVCVLFEGWDASGKGGAIKRLVAPLDIRHVRVAQFAAPTPDEKRHHYLWRFWPQLPGWGGMAVLRPLLVRARAGRAGGGLRDGGAVGARLRRDRRAGADARRRGHGADQVLPAPLGGGAAEALRGAARRPAEGLEADPRRLGEPPQARRSTWRRSRRCSSAPSTRPAPWQLVEAESKKYARVKVVETVIERIEDGMRAQRHRAAGAARR